MRPTALALVGLAACPLVLAAACSSGPSPSGAAQLSLGEGRTVPAERLVVVASAICRAGQAAAAEPSRARTEFESSHADLHLLAQAITLVDRRVASRLLIAKRAVEEGLSSRSPRLPVDLASLRIAVDESLGRLGSTPPPCPSPT